MAGDLARVSYNPARKWRGLVAQQGRVSVEADWNEAATIGQERDRLVTLDVVGATGTPDGGYSVAAAAPPATPGDITIGPGTLYLGGERLNLDAAVTYSNQPEWLDYSTDPLWVATAPPSTGCELVYLLASEQEVSAVEDPALADVALGGPDTMQRLRILQRFLRLQDTPSTCGGALEQLVTFLASKGLQLDRTSMMAESSATLLVSFPTETGSTDPCQPVAAGGYLGAENQMIRVMVTGADSNGPTIVWGFDDASLLYRLGEPTYDPGTDTTTLTLATVPVDSFHYPAVGQTVEVLRDAVQLTAPDSAANPPITGDYIASATGLIATVTGAYDPTQRQLEISGQLPADYASGTALLYLRVWQDKITITPAQAATLGNTGVAVTLDSATGIFHLGDFWRFALRPIQPTIVYPARYLSAPQPPDGPRTWACPLAVLTWTDADATALSCVPPFADLVELTAKGSCCTVDVGPAQVGGGTALQTLLDSYSGQGPVTICLEPGTYTLPEPLVLGESLNGITLQGCRGGVVLQALNQPMADPAFAVGLVAVQGATSVTIRDIELSVPFARFTTPDGAFAGFPEPNLELLARYAKTLQVAIGISGADVAGLTVEGCTFTFPDPGTANVFGAGIFITGILNGAEVSGCTFQSASPPATVPFYDLAVGNASEPPWQLTFGYLQLPGSPEATSGLVLHDAAIEQCLFQGVTVPVLAMTQLGTLRIEENTIRNCYGGVWLVPMTDASQLSLFYQYATGNHELWMILAAMGRAAIVDRILMIAGAIGQLLPTVASLRAPLAARRISGLSAADLALARQMISALMVRADAGTPGEAPAEAGGAGVGPAAAPAEGQPGGVPPAARAVLAPIRPRPRPVIPAVDTGTSVFLRLELSHCQADAIIASSYSGAGLLVLDLTQGIPGSALVHNNRIRTQFPLGETAVAWALGEATVTGNIMTNEFAPPAGNAASPTTYSLALFTAPTTLNVAAVAITGNVFINPTVLPQRPDTIPQDLADWDVLNTVIIYPEPPTVTGISPPSGVITGGDTVTITGTGFTGTFSVAFGGIEASGWTVNSETQITATSPAGTSTGPVDITVATSAGTSATSAADQFTYLPAVTSVVPSTGFSQIENQVQILGAGFTGAVSVMFGGIPALSMTVNSDTNISVVAPLAPEFETVFVVDVTVITPAGSSPINPGDRFIYQPIVIG